jgi:hypothetical protein
MGEVIVMVDSAGWLVYWNCQWNINIAEGDWEIGKI